MLEPARGAEPSIALRHAAKSAAKVTGRGQSSSSPRMSSRSTRARSAGSS